MSGQLKRYDYIDVAKGLGMLTIIWGHIYLYGFSNNLVYAFHIPLFFFLSGMVFSADRYTDFRAFVIRKLQTLIIPYIIYSVITWVIWAVYVKVTHQTSVCIWAPLLETLIARGSEGYLIHNVPLWFVPCLFITEIIYYLIHKCSQITRIIIGIFLAALGYFLVTYVKAFDFTTLPWSIEVVMLVIIFYILGNILIEKYGHHNVLTIINRNPWVSAAIAIISIIIVGIVAATNGSPSMGHARVNSPYLFYIGAMCGIIFMILLSVWFSGSNLFKGTISKWVLWFGSNSFIAMAIHNPIKGFLISIASKLIHIPTHQINSCWYISLIIWVITLVTTIITMLLIIKIKEYFKQRTIKSSM